ncbi:MAG: hypothetical protein ACKVQA_20295 [Burkholderiales bacterium]
MAQEISLQPIVWRCWLGEKDDYNIHCVRDAGSLADAASEPESGTYDDDMMREDLFAPGKPKNIARLVRESPAGYASVLWSVPLFNLPTGEESVKMLAESVMCGSDSACTVTLDTSPLRAARR